MGDTRMEKKSATTLAPDVIDPSPESQAEPPPLEVEVENGEESIDDHDGGYGWVCVVAQLLITANTWGVNGVSCLCPPGIALEYCGLITVNSPLASTSTIIFLPMPFQERRKWHTPSSAVCRYLR